MTVRPQAAPLLFPQMLTAGALAHGWLLHYLHFGLHTVFVRTGIIGVSMELTYLSEIK